MKDLILQPEYPGLGDHLFYSHIPRIAIEFGGYNRVFISNLAGYRNPDVKKLVWELNPYVSGFVDAPGEAPPVTLPSNAEDNLLDQVMFSFGLDDGQRWHEPEVYYEPRFLPGYAGTLYDPNYISVAGDHLCGETVSKFLNKSEISIDIHMRALNDRAVSLPGYTRATALDADLFPYCDILFSCSNVYCLATGTATLCAALRKKATVFYTKQLKEMFLHSRVNDYVLVESSVKDTLVKDTLFSKIKKKLSILSNWMGGV